MDFQRSLYRPALDAKSYLSLLRDSVDGSVFDYYSRQGVAVQAVDARQMIYSLQERTLISIALLQTFDAVCEEVYQRVPSIARQWASWWDMRQWARGLFQGEGNWYHSSFRQEKEDIFGKLYLRIISSLRDGERAKLEQVPCGGIFLNDVSAYALAAPNGEPGILIPWNLFFFLYRGSGQLLRYLDRAIKHTLRDDDGPDDEAVQVFEESFQALAHLAADSCYSGPELFRMPRLVTFDRAFDDLLMEPRSGASVVALSGLAFVLLHEIGHILRGHLRSLSYVPVAWERDSISGMFASSAAEEDEADYFAITRLFNSVISLLPGPLHLKILGPCFVFALYRIREAMFERWSRRLAEILEREEGPVTTTGQRVKGEGTVTVWETQRGEVDLIEGPAHPLTVRRLQRVVDETLSYVGPKTMGNEMVVVIRTILETAFCGTIEYFCNEIAVKGEVDDVAAASAKEALERMRGVW